MNAEFWQERWRTGQIGFHEARPNAFLGAHAARLELGAGSRILVPLCGKSTDLTFLARAGLDVTGVEFVPEAALAYFTENGLTPTTEPWLGFSSLRATAAEGSVRIAIGSFFDLAVPAGQGFDAAYDRAALVAVRPEDRPRYATTLTGALRPGGRVLLVTFAYQGTMTGPPFSVSESEVRTLFSGAQVEKLDERDLIEDAPRFRERGASAVVEQAWLVTRG